jgi:AcrR family transcriptional regulator
MTTGARTNRAEWTVQTVNDQNPKTASAKKRSNSRERIIDAAIAVAQDDGAGKMSLEAVAERAGVSKGGLLYHFNSKSALLQAMVERHVRTLDDAIETAHAEIVRDKRPNALIRAYLHAFRAKLCASKKTSTGFLAAIAEEPALLNPVRDHHTRLIKDLKASSDNPELAIIAFLAVEGIWNLRLFDTNPFADGELIAHFDRLMDLLADPQKIR